jgi:Tol biopolymer transport system component
MNTIRLRHAIVAAAVIASPACRDSSHATAPVHPTATLMPPPDFGSRIVFTKLSEHQQQDEFVVAEIYIMNADGTDERRITSNTQFDIFANLSPNGMTIAFHQGFGAQCCSIQLVDIDGSNERTLTTGAFPSWSADGQKIAFNAPGVGGVGDIWVINVDGTGLTNLTQTPSGEARPDWSPSGQQIAFQSNRSGNPEIWVMDADGSNAIRLTDHLARDEAPDWSPDGRKIVFQSARDDPQFDVYVMNADGTELQRLTIGGGRDLDPDWSPDGAQIAFDSDRDFVVEQFRRIFVMNADGTNQRPLTGLPSENGHAGWGRGRAVLP